VEQLAGCDLGCGKASSNVRRRGYKMQSKSGIPVHVIPAKNASRQESITLLTCPLILGILAHSAQLLGLRFCQVFPTSELQYSLDRQIIP